MKETNADFVRVDEWEPADEDRYLYYSGKLIIIPFDRIFNRPGEDAINRFIIKKDSYVTKLEHFTNYINYFIKFYDKDKELLLSYFKLKYLADKKEHNLKLKDFIQKVYGVLLTDSIREKVHQMVEDNYYIELTSKRKGNYPESLEFTQEHAKVMMEISICMKIMVPIMFHYIYSNNLKKDTPLHTILYTFYAPLFNIIGGDINIYNKLYETVKIRVTKNYNDNKFLWEQREIKGDDPLLKINELLKKDVISDTMPRYRFDNSIIAFNSVIIESQLGYYNIEPYKFTMVELTNKKDPEGLSGLDKLEMNSVKIDESLPILSSINVKDVIKRIRKSMKIEISDKEFDYYMKHHKINKFQVQLVFYYYAKYFGGYRDLNMLTRVQYMQLLVLLKKRLQYQGMVYLPQIMSGNTAHLKNRLIQNRKFLDKIEHSSVYKSLVEDKFSTLEEVNKGNMILGLLSTILNSTFTVVDPNHKDRLGQEIEINNPDILSDEFLTFLNQI